MSRLTYLCCFLSYVPPWCCLTARRCILLVADCCLISDPSHNSFSWSGWFLQPFESILVPGEEGNTSLVPDVRWNTTGRDLHWRNQVSPLCVQIDRDLNGLSRLINLIFVNPLEIYAGQSALERLCELDSFLFCRELRTLHREAGHYETLGVLSDFFFR